MKKHIILGAVFTALASTSALAESFPLGGGITLTPSLDARVRFETVDQDNAVADAEALTVRLRPGISLGSGGFSLLVEGEGTFGIVNHYNDTNAANGVEPYSVVADPESIELNRAQLQYKSKAVTLTAGRQRINIDDQRFVGSVGWRQNEQTFDAGKGCSVRYRSAEPMHGRSGRFSAAMRGRAMRSAAITSSLAREPVSAR